MTTDARNFEIISKKIEIIRENITKVNGMFQINDINRKNKKAIRNSIETTEKLIKETVKKLNELNELHKTNNDWSIHQVLINTIENLRKEISNFLNCVKIYRDFVQKSYKTTVSIDKLKSNNYQQNVNKKDFTGVYSGQSQTQFQVSTNKSAVEEEKEEELAELEKDIVNLNEMFLNVDKLIDNQGLTIQQIHDKISNTRIDTSRGKENIERAYALQKKSRRKKILIIILVVIVVVIVIITVISYFGNKFGKR